MVVLISHRGRSNAAPSCNRTRACEVRRAAAAPPSAKVSQLLQRQLKAPDPTGSWTLAGQFPPYIDGQISLDSLPSSIAAAPRPTPAPATTAVQPRARTPRTPTLSVGCESTAINHKTHQQARFATGTTENSDRHARQRAFRITIILGGDPSIGPQARRQRRRCPARGRA